MTADTDLATQRRSFAEEIRQAGRLRTPALVEALATVPREQFLPPGPWRVQGERDFAGPRETPDADPGHVCQNVSIAIDPNRMLFNGAPGAVAPLIDALALRAGNRVLHVGTGLGYYTALIAHCVGAEGRVRAIEVDETLADGAAANLTSWPWVAVEHGDGRETRGETYDAILISAGVTHPHETWLRALTPGGRLVLPLTFTMEEMGPLGKGISILLSKTDRADSLDARVLGMTMIYSAEGLRDEGVNDRLRNAFLQGGPPALQSLQLDRHEPTDACWLHEDGFCLS